MGSAVHGSAIGYSKAGADMPTKANSWQQKPAEWVSMDLTESQEKDMKSRFNNWDVVNEFLIKEIEGGYKVTLSYDGRNKSYSAYLIPVGDKHPNAGYILTCRGGSPFSALRGLGYRHFVLLEGDWIERQSRNVDSD